MAGNPRRRAVIAELLRRAREEQGEIAEGKEQDALVTYAESWIAAGNTLWSLSLDLCRVLGTDISRDMVSKILNAAVEETGRESALAHARTRGAHALVEQSLTIADGVEETREAIQKAKLQADVRQWTAGHWNRAEYGPQLKVEGSISVHHMHLDAMRARVVTGASVAPALAPAAVEDAEYEVLEADDEAKSLAPAQLALPL